MKKILIYTDSRGQVINNIQPYSHKLKNLYNCELHICEEKWTTTLDFFRLIENKNLNNYDYVILQTSVVENSPRIKKDAYEKIYLDPKKKFFFDKVFGEKNMKDFYKTKFEYLYEGQETLNLFSIEMGIKYLVPKLSNIPNLIWISNNPLVGGNGKSWRGNYWKDRPENMEIVNEFSKEYIKNLNGIDIINNTNWTDTEIKKYTIDNIHYTNEGHNLIFKKITNIINA